jgi:nucleoside-diphosphate-sugar epimerase
MEQRKGLIVVTGSSGRIGKKVVKRFSNAGFQVVGFDVAAPKDLVPGFEFIKVDLTSEESVRQCFESIRSKYGNTITSVIHLAAYYSFSKGDPALYEAITVQGSRRMLKFAKTFNCEQFLFSSTQLIYAPCDVGQSINEHSSVKATWGYPLSKVQTENALHQEHGSVPIVILQIAGCYDDECHSIPISNQIQRIYEKQATSRLFPGNLTHGAPFLHLDDLTDAIWLAVEKRKQLPPETTLIIGEGKTMSYDAMQREISKLIFGKEMTTVTVPKWFAKFGAVMMNLVPFGQKSFIEPWMIDLADDNYTLDISNAQRQLGWNPKNSVKNVLPKMIDFLKKNPRAFYIANGLQPVPAETKSSCGCCCSGKEKK